MRWSETIAGAAGASGSVIGGAAGMIMVIVALNGAPIRWHDDVGPTTERPLFLRPATHPHPHRRDHHALPHPVATTGPVALPARASARPDAARPPAPGHHAARHRARRAHVSPAPVPAPAPAPVALPTPPAPAPPPVESPAPVAQAGDAPPVTEPPHHKAKHKRQIAPETPAEQPPALPAKGRGPKRGSRPDKPKHPHGRKADPAAAGVSAQTPATPAPPAGQAPGQPLAQPAPPASDPRPGKAGKVKRAKPGHVKADTTGSSDRNARRGTGSRSSAPRSG